MTRYGKQGKKENKKSDLLNKLLDPSLQRRRISSHNITLFLPTLVQQECGHSADANVRRRLSQLVDVNLVELGLRVLEAQLGDFGSDGLARAAPGRVAVDDDGVLGLDDLFLVFRVADLLLVSFCFLPQGQGKGSRAYLLMVITLPWSDMVEYVRGVVDWSWNSGVFLTGATATGVVIELDCRTVG